MSLAEPADMPVSDFMPVVENVTGPVVENVTVGVNNARTDFQLVSAILICISR